MGAGERAGGQAGGWASERERHLQVQVDLALSQKVATKGVGVEHFDLSLGVKRANITPDFGSAPLSPAVQSMQRRPVKEAERCCPPEARSRKPVC